MDLHLGLGRQLRLFFHLQVIQRGIALQFLGGGAQKHNSSWQTYPCGQKSRYTDSGLPLIGKIGTLLSAAHLRETETHEFPHCTAEAVAASLGWEYLHPRLNSEV